MAKKIEEELLEKGAQKVTDEDVRKVVAKSEEIKKKFRPGGPLGRFIEDGQMLLSMVKDYWSGRYRQVPYGTIAAIVFTLIYVFIFVEQDLLGYKQWKQSQNESH